MMLRDRKAAQHLSVPEIIDVYGPVSKPRLVDAKFSPLPNKKIKRVIKCVAVYIQVYVVAKNLMITLWVLVLKTRALFGAISGRRCHTLW